jgi:hypothetical protein
MISAGECGFQADHHSERLDKFESICKYAPLTLFASSHWGWITGDLFVIPAIDFYGQLSLYRSSLLSDIAGEPVLLILDGHISFGNITAPQIFYVFNLDILILSCHTTHVAELCLPAVPHPASLEASSDGRTW